MRSNLDDDIIDVGNDGAAFFIHTGNDLFDVFQAMHLIAGIDSFRRISDFEVNAAL